MKSTIMAGVFLFASFASGEARVITIHQKDDKTTGSSIPADVHQIFENSCFDCHSKGGKKMAMSHVNFSVWDSYSDDKKEKKSADIVKMLKKGAMPPKLYRQSHPDKIPSAEQIALISQWAETLKEK